ncbi:MAG: methyltransferase [Gemmatimonadales bacterium]
MGATPAAVTRLWQMADIITPFALRVAATLRLADHVAAGATEVPALARLTGADPDALRRLLRYLAARDLFAEPEPGRFALTGLGAVLRDDHPTATRRWLDLEGFGGTMDLAFVDLLTAIRTGRPPRSAEESELSDPVSESFDDVMESQSRQQTPAIVAAFDWTTARHVVDLGGGTGTLLVGLLRAYPAMRGTLVELPRTAERARPVIAGAGLAERCRVVAGDLFEVALPAADVYVLKFLIHGYDDDGAAAALRRCREAGEAGARVLVIERTVAPGEDHAPFTAMDLRMLILTGGRERTLDEYAALARRAGLRVHAATPTPVDVHVIVLSP